MENRVPARLSPAEGRKFAFTVGAAFLVLGAFVWWRGNLTLATVFGALGGTLGVLGVAVPGKLGPLNAAWMGLAHLISKVTTPIFMGIVYFLVITPIGFVMRLFGWNPLRHGSGTSAWVPHSKDRGTMSNQF